MSYLLIIGSLIPAGVSVKDKVIFSSALVFVTAQSAPRNIREKPIKQGNLKESSRVQRALSFFTSYFPNGLGLPECLRA